MLRALRFALTLPYSIVGLAWGLAWGGYPRWRPGAIIECSSMRGGYARAGIMIGSVWLCGTLNDDARLRHESVHATQWAIFGPIFPILYWIAEAAFPMERNPFERWAGLRDGGYLDDV
jgi:hypothetical protein